MSPDIERLLTFSPDGGGLKTSRRPDPVRVMSPQTAYLMLSGLRQITVSGTAAKAQRLKRRDIAGKTGTTDDCTDAWFIGFNPKYTTGVWFGYDAKVSLGKKEYGSRAALPVWMDFMGEALASEPETGYPAPPGIVFDLGTNRRVSELALLESDPDLAPDILRKQFSPVDLPAFPVAAQANLVYGGATDPSQNYGYGQTVGPAPPNPYYQGGYGQPVGPPAPNPYQQYAYGGHAGRYPGMIPPQPGMYGQATYYGNGYGDYGYGGNIRVLNPSGETLGYAPYSVDENGKMVVHRDYLTPAYEQDYGPVTHEPVDPFFDEETPAPPRREANRGGPAGPIESFLPGASRIIEGLQQFIPRLRSPEWIR